ncbi:HDOD domain-containing protein [Marinobacterium lutimaris]|uniref:HD-like signal output (HDOD) domain, no enzymatic activity n=1 Tax=Marinobacterium lutimaris TaxID=568106 RepID=A0A1H6APF6_9GAMM|nr:HDOD domain-containing protein [Marinobacterium lutimaris]SEG49656.1 HD-like signal output (HDOD) domain, no enzymatic activity [Marinobacterium lutimaris]
MNRAETGESKETGPLKILFIDPHSAFVTWGSGLVQEGCNWEIVRNDDQRVALELLRQTAFDAVIVGAISSFEREIGILKQVSQIKPKVARILLSPPLSSTKLAKALDVVHRTIFQGASIEEIIASVEQTVLVTRQLYRDKVVRSFGAFRQLPSSPSIYRELSNALSSERTNTRDIAIIVERDPALAVRIIRLVNSSYFGLNRTISSLTEALTLLGVRTVRGLALSGHLNAHYPDDSGWKLFSFDRMNQRALSVARLAQEIATPFAKNNPALKDQAFLAGLLLDVGMLMLAAEQGEGYLKVLRFAARKKQPLHLVERMAYGVTHAELGAYLLDMWNLSPQVVEAVMMHHNPEESVGQTFNALCAVHIADALLPTIDNELGVDLSATLSEEYIERMDVKAHMPTWKMAANAYRIRMRDSERSESA